jgi:hypothetical protein
MIGGVKNKQIFINFSNGLLVLIACTLDLSTTGLYINIAYNMCTMQ